MEANPKVTIAVAVLGVISALVTNWDKVFPKRVEPTVAISTASAAEIQGLWELKTWTYSEGRGVSAVSGELMIDQPLSGTLTLIAADDKRRIVQSVTLTETKTGYILQGKVVSGEDWNADKFVLSVDSNRLVGIGTDTEGQRSRVEFLRAK